MTHSPEPAVNELLDEINRAIDGDQLSEFEIAQLKQKANRLMATDPVGASEALGAIACLEGDEDAMRGHHARALRLYPNDPRQHKQFATSLANRLHHSEALQRLREAYRLSPDNIEVLETAISYSYRTLRFRECATYLHDWEMRKPDAEHRYKQSIESLAAFAERERIQDEEFAAVADTVEEVARRHRGLWGKYVVQLSSDDSSTWVSFRHWAHTLRVDPFELNLELTALLAEKDIQAAASGKVVPMFSAKAAS